MVGLVLISVEYIFTFFWLNISEVPGLWSERLPSNIGFGVHPYG